MDVKTRLDNINEKVFEESVSKENFFQYLSGHIRSKQLSLFVGAGISKNSPSNLPLSHEFRSYIFKKLCSENELIELYDRFVERLDNIPFEAFIQIIVENSKEFFNHFLKIFRSGKPNKAHILIAKLVKQGLISEIMTTNFDTLLEEAFYLKKE